MMMPNLINTIELAICLILPLILFYKSSQWSTKKTVFYIPILYGIWYLSYGVFHELSHLIGVWIFGKEIYNYQLISRFWEGQFGTGFVNYNYQADGQDFFIVALPYFRDLFLFGLGFILLTKNTTKNAFVAGLLWIILVLSPLYDVLNNYLAFLLGSKNDFNALSESSNAFVSHFIGLSFSLTFGYLSIRLLLKTQNYPNNQGAADT